MEASERAAVICTGARQAVAKHGDEIWDWATSKCMLDERYSTDQIVEMLLPHFPLAYVTLRQYIKATLRTVVDEGHDQVREFGRYWIFPSEPNNPDNS